MSDGLGCPVGVRGVRRDCPRRLHDQFHEHNTEAKWESGGDVLPTALRRPPLHHGSVSFTGAGGGKLAVMEAAVWSSVTQA